MSEWGWVGVLYVSYVMMMYSVVKAMITDPGFLIPTHTDLLDLTAQLKAGADVDQHYCPTCLVRVILRIYFALLTIK